jgi:hypothetical protein
MSARVNMLRTYAAVVVAVCMAVVAPVPAFAVVLVPQHAAAVSNPGATWAQVRVEPPAITAGGLLFDRVTGAILYDSVTGAPLTA